MIEGLHRAMGKCVQVGNPVVPSLTVTNINPLSVVTEDTKTPENPQNVCPAKSCHVNGTVPLSGDSPDAKGREMSCVEKENGGQK